MGGVEEKLPPFEPGQEPSHLLLAADGSAGAGDAGDHPILIALGLKTTDEPGADIGESLIVEIDRVLGGEHHSQPVGAGLLEQQQHRLFRGRLGGGRKIAENLVHIEQGLERATALLTAQPTDGAIQQHGDEEHSLALTKMRQGKNGGTRLAFLAIKQALDIEGRSLGPGGEGRPGEQGIEVHRQGHALRLGIKGLKRKDPDLGKGRTDNRPDQPFQGEILAEAPVMEKDRTQQQVLAALQRVAGDVDQRQQAGDGGGHQTVDGIDIGHRLGRRGGKASQHRERSNGSAGGIDLHFHAAAQGGDALRTLVPGSQPLFPGGSGVGGQLLDTDSLFLGLGGIEPGLEIARGQVGKGQQQVGHIALGIDDQRRDIVHDRLLDQADTETGLATAGHADDHPVGGEILVLKEERRGWGLSAAGGEVDLAPEVEQAKLFVGIILAHDRSLRLRLTGFGW